MLPPAEQTGSARPAWQPPPHVMASEDFQMAAGSRWDRQAVLEEQRRMRLEAETSRPPSARYHTLGTQAELRARRRAERAPPQHVVAGSSQTASMPPSPQSPPLGYGGVAQPMSPYAWAPGADGQGADAEYGTQAAMRARRRAAQQQTHVAAGCRSPPNDHSSMDIAVDRPSSRVLAAPGGASSMSSIMGGYEGHRQPPPPSPQSAMMAIPSPGYSRGDDAMHHGSQEALKARRAASRMPPEMM